MHVMTHSTDRTHLDGRLFAAGLDIGRQVPEELVVEELVVLKWVENTLDIEDQACQSAKH